MDTMAPRQSPDDAHSGERDADGDFVVESGHASFDQRLTPRGKLVRTSAIVGLVLTTLFVLLGGPAAAARLLHHSGPLRAGPLVASVHPLIGVTQIDGVTLPTDTQANATLDIAPVNGATGGAYACWLAPDVRGNSSGGALHAAALAGNSRVWQTLRLPRERGVRCVIIPDISTSGSVLVAVWNIAAASATASTALCALPHLYQSSNGGSAWSAVSWPAGTNAACTLQFTLVERHIYASSDHALLSTGAANAMGATPGEGRILMTADAGRSWQVADSGLDVLSRVTLLAVRPGQHLLAQTTLAGPTGESILWESADAGRHWQSLGNLPGALPQVYVSSDPSETSHGGWGRLYLSGQTETNGVPDGPDHTYLASAYVGSGWRPFAAPAAVTALSSDVSRSPFFQVTVGPRETLLITHVDDAGDGGNQSSPFTLWAWNPARQRWAWDSGLLPSALIGERVAWSPSGIGLWCTHERLSVTHPLELFTYLFTATDLS